MGEERLADMDEQEIEAWKALQAAALASASGQTSTSGTAHNNNSRRDIGHE